MNRKEIAVALDKAADRAGFSDGASRQQCWKLACMMEEYALTPEDLNLDDPRVELTTALANKHIDDLK